MNAVVGQTFEGLYYPGRCKKAFMGCSNEAEAAVKFIRDGFTLPVFRYKSNVRNVLER